MLTIFTGVLIPATVLLCFILVNVVYLPYLERKVLAYKQGRSGPKWAGWQELLQPAVDAATSLAKGNLVPAKTDKRLFRIALVFLLVTAFGALAAIPFGPLTNFYGLLSKKAPLWVANLNIGVLYVFTLTIMGVYGVILAGLASPDKRSVMSGFRSAAQMMSFGVPMVFVIMTVVFMAGSLDLSDIVIAQTKRWFLFTWIGPVIFFLYLLAGIASTSRVFFAVSPDGGGFVPAHEFGHDQGRFGIGTLVEYLNMLLVSLLAATLFLGGWLPMQFAGSFSLVVWINKGLAALPAMLWLLAKFYFIIICYMWLRTTLLQFRADRLLVIYWKILLPVSLGALLAAAGMKQMGWL